MGECRVESVMDPLGVLRVERAGEIAMGEAWSGWGRTEVEAVVVTGGGNWK